ncbi:MAG: small multi-drug export protein [Clostridia bacterium]|nr:small multi-drug export protein [Clostridia bacterium]
MGNALSEWLISSLGGVVPEEVIIFIISLFPILELRGGLIAAKLLGVKFIPAFIICFIGNMLPIPFILLFIRQVFQWLKKIKGVNKLIEKLEVRTMRKSKTIEKYREWGLLLFVGIPLPGTGGWTGALLAALMDLRMKKAFPIIALGVFIAGVIMSVLTYLVPGLFGF